MYIILDMHQDLFAQKFIDGAPDWAVWMKVYLIPRTV